MVRIQPFVGYRPRPNKVASVASVPYDVISTEEARKLAAGNPASFLHVIRSEIDLPPSTDPYDDVVYAKAKENLDRFVSEGLLVKDEEPAMFLYRQVMDHRAQVGLVCCCHIDDYRDDLIKKHEKTRQDKEDDRTRHVLTLNANAEPVFLTFRSLESIDRLMQTDMSDRPVFHFKTPDGVTHTVWRVSDAAAYVDAFGSVPCLYIADGHHRSASAARAGEERRQANANHTGDEAYNWFLTVVFPESQLQILPYNRVVKDLHGLQPGKFLDVLSHEGRLNRACGQKVPKEHGSVCIYLNDDWHMLTFDPSSIDHDDPIRSLDVSLLQDRVLDPVLGIKDPRTDKRIEFIGGIRGTAELERLVDSGRASAAFSLYPTTIAQLLAVADAGLVMPPKSTWFEPKLRSGLFVRMLD